MKIHYLEIVTPEVDAVCGAYGAAQRTTFGAPDPSLGGARVAPLAGGGSIGVRPLRDTEAAVTRAYWLVEDIDAALDASAAQGAIVAHPATDIPGHGTFAIIIQGDVESGFWQL